MKKNNVFNSIAQYFAICLLITIPFAGCKASENQISSERNLPAFSELNLCISANVILTQGPIQKVDIQASDRLLQLIETEVKGNKLTIKWSEKFVRNNENIKIYITMTEIKSLRISGSGDIISTGNLSAADVDLGVSGSGTIKLENLKAENIHSSISGSADIVIGGTSSISSLNASISGSGNIKAQNIAVKNVDISVSGSGSCYITALESIKARVSGSGDIYYSGQPTIDARVSGSGSIKHVD